MYSLIFAVIISLPLWIGGVTCAPFAGDNAFLVCPGTWTPFDKYLFILDEK
jgi:hypothetical protein